MTICGTTQYQPKCFSHLFLRIFLGYHVLAQPPQPAFHLFFTSLLFLPLSFLLYSYGLTEFSGYDTFLSNSLVLACNLAQGNEQPQQWSLITGCCSPDFCRTFGVTHVVQSSGEVQYFIPPPNPRVYYTNATTPLIG